MGCKEHRAHLAVPPPPLETMQPQRWVVGTLVGWEQKTGKNRARNPTPPPRKPGWTIPCQPEKHAAECAVAGGQLAHLPCIFFHAPLRRSRIPRPRPSATHLVSRLMTTIARSSRTSEAPEESGGRDSRTPPSRGHVGAAMLRCAASVPSHPVPTRVRNLAYYFPG